MLRSVGPLLPMIGRSFCQRSLVGYRKIATPARLSRNFYELVPAISRLPRASTPVPTDILGISKRALFHTSARHHVHPVLWLILKPFTKVWIILWGRFFRKWWNRAPQAERNHMKRLVRDSWHILASLLLIAISLFGVYYTTHLQVCPITGRRRFLVLTPQQMQAISSAERDKLKETYGSTVVPTDHPSYNLVKAVVERIVLANDDLDAIRNTQWQITLVKDETMVNAMVLPTGDIFVFTGLFKLIQNVDQLSIILAHELSHVLLNHSAEHLSFAQLLDFSIIAVMAALWLFIPHDGIAFVTQWFYSRVLQIGADFPYNRFLEKEADEVGLLLAAKACFDVRQGPAFWNAMGEVAKASDEVQIPTLLSTHPAHDSRTQNLYRKLPEAIRLREMCSCPPLPLLSVSVTQIPVTFSQRPAQQS